MIELEDLEKLAGTWTEADFPALADILPADTEFMVCGRWWPGRMDVLRETCILCGGDIAMSKREKAMAIKHTLCGPCFVKAQLKA